jgi:hypothetical protein
VAGAGEVARERFYAQAGEGKGEGIDMSIDTQDHALVETPDTLKVGAKIFHKGACYTVVAIKNWLDLTHGRVYALDLEAGGKNLRISVAEGAKLEECGYE